MDIDRLYSEAIALIAEDWKSSMIRERSLSLDLPEFADFLARLNLTMQPSGQTQVSISLSGSTSAVSLKSNLFLPTISCTPYKIAKSAGGLIEGTIECIGIATGMVAEVRRILASNTDCTIRDARFSRMMGTTDGWKFSIFTGRLSVSGGERAFFNEKMFFVEYAGDGLWTHDEDEHGSKMTPQQLAVHLTDIIG